VDTQQYLIEKYQIDLKQLSPFWVTCNRLVDLPPLFKELGFTSGAEVGVCWGAYSEILCQSNPDLTVYSIDPWVHYPLRRNFRRAYVYEPMYQHVVQLLAPYPNSRIIRKKSMEAVLDFPDNSLDFVFIDADHRFEFVTNDIAEWSKKVRVGGIISGHDYGVGPKRISEFVHTPEVVHAWTHAHNIHPWYVLDNRYERGWMWVKVK